MPSAVLLPAKTDGMIEPKKSEQTKVEDTVNNFMSKQIEEKQKEKKKPVNSLFIYRQSPLLLSEQCF